MNYAETVSVDLKLTINGRSFKGIAVADLFPNSSPIIIDRIYDNLVDEEIYLIIGTEEILAVIRDGGEKFEIEYEKHNLNTK